MIETKVKIWVILVIRDGKGVLFNYFKVPTPLAKISNLTFYKATEDYNSSSSDWNMKLLGFGVYDLVY